MKLLTVNRLSHIILLLFLVTSCTKSNSQNTTMKQQDEKTEIGLKKALNKLIEPDENFGVASLEHIYHKDMIVVMIDENDNKTVFKKPAFVELIATKLAGDERTKNTWAKFIHLEIANDQGHIVVKRRVNLTDIQKEITVILDFVWEENRWQIIREVILT